ncbi:MAG: 3-phosphoshikimate 1-carboxyvinyltransferase, partial [Bacteroidales bacterium]|nr:3-phosphoshikimate 1-carboxyvinyltransferase [Bacteroidales bacterium]
ISNRVLLMKNLSGSNSRFENLSNSDDTKRINFYFNFIDTCLSSGVPMIIDTQNAGTVLRFLTAYIAISDGKWLVTGSERMLERPVGELVDALTALGATINYSEKQGFPPLLIQGRELKGGSVSINPRQSSQFISALMMIGPYLKDGLEIVLEKSTVSTPYISMTAKLMKLFGIDVEITTKRIIIPAGDYTLTDYNIEPDWSSASYWYEVVALSKHSQIFIPKLTNRSIQGDAIVAQLFDQLGVETIYREDGILLKSKAETVKYIDFNFKDYPDLAPTVMATCAAKGIELMLRGINHLKYKESNRILSMDEELSKIGCSISRQGQAYILKPGELPDKAEFNTHNDHRIAMCLAPLSLKIKEIDINNPDVNIKSYPDFWDDMQRLGVFEVSIINT